MEKTKDKVLTNVSIFRASPMKVIKIPASGVHSAFQQHQNISSENSSNMPPGVKVVKLSAASATNTNQRVTYSSQVIFGYLHVR